MIQAADAYIIGTPIYRGAYTGSLKNSRPCARRSAHGQSGQPIANGGSDHHYLSIDYVLRSVLMVQHAPRARQCLRAWVSRFKARRWSMRKVDNLERSARPWWPCTSAQGSPMGPLPLSLKGRRRG